MERKLATVQTIKNLKPIENSDFLELAEFESVGWRVVVKKGEYQVGEKVAYFEIDSFMPTTLAPFLTEGKRAKVFDGVEGSVLKTKKIRGVLSQGLVLKTESNEPDGYDLTEELGIKKYEKAEPVTGQCKGSFPVFVPKTDQERIQSLPQEQLNEWYNQGIVFEKTLKLDGSSITVYYKDGQVGVCSRNLELKLYKDIGEFEYKPADIVHQGRSNVFTGDLLTKIREVVDNIVSDSHFVKTAFRTGLIQTLQDLGKNIAIQAEIMGPKIQNNREDFDEFKLFVYDVFDIDKQEYYGCEARIQLIESLINNGVKIGHCPVLSTKPLESNDKDELLKLAEVKSINNPVGEGVVYKSVCGKHSFKAISNLFLLGE